MKWAGINMQINADGIGSVFKIVDSLEIENCWPGNIDKQLTLVRLG